MNWYYAEQGKQIGPITDEQLTSLLQSGTITADTLVWREGMANWTAYGQLQGAASSPTATLTDTRPQAACAECGAVFPADDMIRYGDVRVCATCKPIFLQKLQEGAPLQTGELPYAAFWPRFLAYFLDVIILTIFNQLVTRLLTLAFIGSFGVRPGMPAGLLAVTMAFPFAVGICYEGLLVGRYGATLGKMAMKMRVVTADGARISYARAFGRYFAKMLSGFTCLIGFIIAAFDNPQKRALHDYICNTRVVYK